MCKTISLLNMKGGVGKTTLAVNLAWYLMRFESCKVLIVDLDPQFNATQYLLDYDIFMQHRNTKGTIADLLIEQPILRLRKRRTKKVAYKESFIRREEDRHGNYLDLLPSELSFGWVVKNPFQMDYKLEKILESIRTDYNYIFIDCAPTESVLTTIAMTASDFVLVPVRPDRFAILGYGNFLQNLAEFRRNSNNPHNIKELGVVFTHVHRDYPIEIQCMDEIKALAIGEKSYVFDSKLRFSPSYIRAVQDQTPVFDTKHARNAKIDISSVVKEMQKRVDNFK